MIGALVGDISGSRYEWRSHKSKRFPLFEGSCRPTDDSVMTLAVAQAILDADGRMDGLDRWAIQEMQQFGKRYPHAGYGRSFKNWLTTPGPLPYNSWGNGAAMRVSACGWAFDTLEETRRAARLVTGVTHNHPEGLKGGESVAAAIFLLRTGHPLAEVRRFIEKNYYRIGFTLDEIRPDYRFDVSCQGSVPQAFEALFESTGFEDAVRNAISIGGDSDTIGAIAGSMAEACYGVPEDIRKMVLDVFLDETQRGVVLDFERRFPPRSAAPVVMQATNGAIVHHDRLRGLFWGLVVGDCLGSPIQFTGKDSHPYITEMVPCDDFDTPPGYWTDDSSMAFCVAESYARLHRLDVADIGRNFVRWYRDGFWSSKNHAFDIGCATENACEAIAREGRLVNGSEESQGNGSIMRLAPSYLASRVCPAPERRSILHAISDLTHCSARVRRVVDEMSDVLDEHVAGNRTKRKSIYATRREVNNSGWAVSTFEAALWAFQTTESFEDALVAAVNLGGDADSIGAVCGQIAGAYYGFSAIPERWLAPIPRRGEIDRLVEACID